MRIQQDNLTLNMKKSYNRNEEQAKQQEPPRIPEVIQELEKQEFLEKTEQSYLLERYSHNIKPLLGKDRVSEAIAIDYTYKDSIDNDDDSQKSYDKEFSDFYNNPVGNANPRQSVHTRGFSSDQKKLNLEKNHGGLEKVYNSDIKFNQDFLNGGDASLMENYVGDCNQNDVGLVRNIQGFEDGLCDVYEKAPNLDQKSQSGTLEDLYNKYTKIGNNEVNEYLNKVKIQFNYNYFEKLNDLYSNSGHTKLNKYNFTKIALENFNDKGLYNYFNTFDTGLGVQAESANNNNTIKTNIINTHSGMIFDSLDQTINKLNLVKEEISEKEDENSKRSGNNNLDKSDLSKDLPNRVRELEVLNSNLNGKNFELKNDMDNLKQINNDLIFKQNELEHILKNISNELESMNHKPNTNQSQEIKSLRENLNNLFKEKQFISEEYQKEIEDKDNTIKEKEILIIQLSTMHEELLEKVGGFGADSLVEGPIPDPDEDLVDNEDQEILEDEDQVEAEPNESQQFMQQFNNKFRNRGSKSFQSELMRISHNPQDAYMESERQINLEKGMLEGEIGDLKNEIVGLSKEKHDIINDMQLKLNEKESLIDLNENLINQLKNRAEELDQQMEILNLKSDELENNKDLYDKEIMRLQGIIVNLENEKEEIMTQNQMCLQEIAGINEKNISLENERTNMINVNTQLQKMIDAYMLEDNTSGGFELENIRLHLDKKIEEYNELKEAYQMLWKEKEYIEGILEGYKSDLTEKNYEAELVNLNNKICELNELINDMERSLGNKEDKLQICLEENSKFLQKIYDFDSELTTKNDTIINLEQYIQALETEIVEKNDLVNKINQDEKIMSNNQFDYKCKSNNLLTKLDILKNSNTDENNVNKNLNFEFIGNSKNATDRDSYPDELEVHDQFNTNLIEYLEKKQESILTDDSDNFEDNKNMLLENLTEIELKDFERVIIRQDEVENLLFILKNEVNNSGGNGDSDSNNNKKNCSIENGGAENGDLMRLEEGWNELFSEGKKLENAKKELNLWENTLKEQGKDIDSLLQNIVNKEDIQNNELKIYELRKEDLPNLDYINKERNHKNDRISEELAKKVIDLDKKAIEFEIYWKDLDTQRQEVVGLMSVIDGILDEAETRLQNNDDPVKSYENIKNQRKRFNKHTASLENMDKQNKILIDDLKANDLTCINDIDKDDLINKLKAENETLRLKLDHYININTEEREKLIKAQIRLDCEKSVLNDKFIEMKSSLSNKDHIIKDKNYELKNNEHELEKLKFELNSHRGGISPNENYSNGLFSKNDSPKNFIRAIENKQQDIQDNHEEATQIINIENYAEEEEYSPKSQHNPKNQEQEYTGENIDQIMEHYNMIIEDRESKLKISNQLLIQKDNMIRDKENYLSTLLLEKRKVDIDYKTLKEQNKTKIEDISQLLKEKSTIYEEKTQAIKQKEKLQCEFNKLKKYYEYLKNMFSNQEKDLETLKQNNEDLLLRNSQSSFTNSGLEIGGDIHSNPGIVINKDQEIETLKNELQNTHELINEMDKKYDEEQLDHEKLQQAYMDFQSHIQVQEAENKQLIDKIRSENQILIEEIKNYKIKYEGVNTLLSYNSNNQKVGQQATHENTNENNTLDFPVPKKNSYCYDQQQGEAYELDGHAQQLASHNSDGNLRKEHISNSQSPRTFKQSQPQNRLGAEDLELLQANAVEQLKDLRQKYIEVKNREMETDNKNLHLLQQQEIFKNALESNNKSSPDSFVIGSKDRLINKQLDNDICKKDHKTCENPPPNSFAAELKKHNVDYEDDENDLVDPNQQEHDEENDNSEKQIILNENEYLAMVNENQELNEQLEDAKDQLNSLKGKHDGLQEGINTSIKADREKIEVKLDDCFDVIQKSRVTYSDYVSDSKDKLKLDQEYKDNTDTDENLRNINDFLKNKLETILHEKQILEHRLVTLGQYLTIQGMQVPQFDDNENDFVDAQKFPTKPQKFEEGETGKGLTDRKKRNYSISSKRTENRYPNSFKDQIEEYDKLNTRRAIHSDQLGGVNNQDVGVNGNQGSTEDEADISMEKLIELLLWIQQVLENIRRICCIDDINDYQKIDKISYEIDNLEFM